MPSVSRKQAVAMRIAAAGKSNLGIPRDVGREFVKADKGRKFVRRKKRTRHLVKRRTT